MSIKVAGGENISHERKVSQHTGSARYLGQKKKKIGTHKG